MRSPSPRTRAPSLTALRTPERRPGQTCSNVSKAAGPKGPALPNLTRTVRHSAPLCAPRLELCRDLVRAVRRLSVRPRASGCRVQHARPTATVVDALSARLQSGQVSLPFETITGHLKPVLDALDVRVDSQVVVFSKTSLQSNQIRPGNPRAIYFNDAVMVGWVRGGFIEIAAQDPQQGAVFYRVLQAPTGSTAVFRDNRCLQCHNWYATLGVPGFLAKSVPSAIDGSALPWLGNGLTDHRSPLAERWAGWFVTGAGLGRASGQRADRRPKHRRCPCRGREHQPRQPAIALRHHRVPVAAQRRRRAAGVQSPAADDEPADANRLGSANAGARGPQSGRDRQRPPQHRSRSRGLHAVRGRGPALGRTRLVGVCRVVQRARSARRQGTNASRSGSADSASSGIRAAT